MGEESNSGMLQYSESCSVGCRVARQAIGGRHVTGSWVRSGERHKTEGVVWALLAAAGCLSGGFIVQGIEYTLLRWFDNQDVTQ